MRRTVLLCAAALAIGPLSACGGEVPKAAGTPSPPSITSPASALESPAVSSPEATTSSSPAAEGAAPPAQEATTAEPKSTKDKPKPAAKPLKCSQLDGAEVGSATVPFNGYPDSIPLTEGRWAGEDGAEAELQEPCGTGDLDGDGAADALRALKLTADGTGRFSYLVFWRNAGGSPVYRTLADLGDRNPIASISVSGGKATVVYYTRTPDVGMAALNIKRTATYKVSGSKLSELSHNDVPYAGG